MLFVTARHSGEGAFHDEGAEQLAVDFREDDEEVCEPAVGDPHLLAVQEEAAVRLSGGARLGAERIGTRARFAQAVRADQIAGQERREILPLLAVSGKKRQRQDHQVRVRSERCPERGGFGHALADDDRRRLVELNAAIFLGYVDAENPELPAALDEAARESPILLLEPLEDRQHFSVDEVGDRLADHPMLVGESLGREGGAWI